MECILDGSDYEELFMIAHGALLDSKNNNTPFDLNSEIKGLYEAFSDDKAYALGLVQAYPSQLVMALTHTRELSKFHRKNGLTLDTLEDLTDDFEDLNAVVAYLGPDQADAKAIEDINNSIQEEAEKPTELPKQTPSEIDNQTQILVNYVKEFIFKGVSGMATTGQQALLDNKGNWTQEKNPEVDFYYNFFKVFNEEFLVTQDPQTVTINGHTGFKLKAISKTQIDIEVAKPYDQRLVKGEEGFPEGRGQAIYHGGIAVAVADNNGDVLYFDENYNVVGKDQGGKPIYHSVRYIKKDGNQYIADSEVQTIEEMAGNLGISTEMAHSIRQAEYKALYDIRTYINSKRKENGITLDITGVSQGVLNIRKNLPGDIDTSINSINWDKSDVELNIKIAKRDAAEAGERKGGAYISIPGHRSIPIQAGNLTQEDIDKVLELILNPAITNQDGTPVTADVKKKLIEYIILTNDKSLQVIDKKGEFIALFKGKKVTEANKQEIKDFFNERYINPNTKQATQYNNTSGQYAYKEPVAGNKFEEFDIVDGKLIRTPMSLEEHISKTGTLKIIPNTAGKDKVISFLNGYFTFDVSSEDQDKVERLSTFKEDIKEAADGVLETKTIELYRGVPILDTDKIVTQEGGKGAASYNRENNIIKVNRKLLKKKYAEKAWTNPRKLIETLHGKQVESFAKPLHEDQFPTYEDFEQFVIEHEYQHSQLSRADFEKTNPGSTKGQYESEINDRALFTLTLQGNLPLLSAPAANNLGNIESVQEEVKPAEKVKQFKKDDIDLKDDDGLTMSRIIPMKSTPAQIAEAKAWFESSPLAKHIKYEELFNVVNSNAWAHFVNGGIKLYAGSDYTVLYHEAFHAFSQHFLSKEEKIKLYNEAAKLKSGKKAIADWAKSKNTTVEQLSEYQKYLAIEELLAEGFREYAMTGKVLKSTPERESIFRRMLNFLRELFGIELSQSQVATDHALLNVEEVYTQLYIGNINNYRPSVKNAYFAQALASAPQAVEGETTAINDQDALLLVQSIDGAISEYIDERNRALQVNSPGDTRYTSAIFTNPEKHLKEVYKAARNTFIDKYEDINEQIAKAKDEEKEALIGRRDLLADALTNFGDPNNPIKGGGLLAFHMKKSPYMSAHIKNLDKEAFEKTEEDIAASRFDVKGNELSKMDLASNRVSYLIGSIKKYDKDGNMVKNELGFPVLMEFNETFGKIASIIGNNNNSPAEIRTALLKSAAENPWVDALVRKLGPTLSKHHSVNDLWTGFWATFYLSNQKLHETMINEIIDPKTGVRTYEVLTGYASAVFRQAERDFRSNFKISNHPNPYIVDTQMAGNVLDTKAVLDKYRGKLYKREFDFLTDIGIPLTDSKELRAGLKDVNIEYLFDKLDMLQLKNVPITDVIQALREPYVFQTDAGELVIKSESSNINKILGLEVKHSGNYSNASVLTSTGNVAYETSMMSSVAVMVKAINEAETFKDLVAIPYMSYLDYANNPAVRASARLKSLFEYDENTKTFGKRRKDVVLTIDNLDGTQNIIDNAHSDREYSTATSRSDKYTRLMQDIYSLFLEGKPSGITPGDKSTILSINTNTIYTEGKDKHLYVDLGDFAKKGGQVNLGIERAYNVLMPYLEAELQRIVDIERHQTDNHLANIEGYTSKDKKGNISGLDFSAFKGVFKEDTLKKLLDLYKKTGSLESMSPTLRTETLKEMQQYFNFTTEQTKKTLDRMLFIDDNLSALVEKGVGEVLNSIERDNTILKAYTVNKFIHNLDDVTLFYGDLAQYKDLDKRGSALNSVGRMFRTDSDAITYVNDVLQRPLSNKLELNGYKKFDGTLETAVLSEDIEDSKYIAEYKKALEDKGLSEKEIERMMGPYKGMETGDAQGYIAFDSYRILAKLENRWSDQQEALYNQVINDPESVKMQDIAEYFPVRKYQYFGPLATPGIHATAFHKYSLFPLIPTVIKGRKLSELHDKMMKQGIDYATFKTGSKVGTIVAKDTVGGDKIYNKDKSINKDSLFTKNTIYLNYLKDQLDINSEFKGKVIFSTQLRKLIEEGLVEGGVPVDYEATMSIDDRVKAWNELSEKAKLKASPLYTLYKQYEDNIKKLIEFRMAELRAEIGSTEEELASGKGNMAKLVKFIQRELERQDLADHEIDFITEENGKLVRDLSMSPSAAKIEKALNAIVNNRLVRQKVKGEALVQVANSMWEPSSSSDEEKLSWGTKDLKTYRKGPDGKTLGMDVKIALQGDFKNLINLKHRDGKKVAVYIKRKKEDANGNVIFTREINSAATLARLNETIQDPKWRANKDNLDMITMVGVRIPVQGLNSMEFMVIQEFLPEAAGNIIVPPAEIVAKSGSDFDIDKLTIMMPSTTIVNGEPVITREISGDPKDKLKRVDAINEELKDLRAKKSELQKENTEKFKEATSKNLSEEDKAELKIAHKYFDEQVKELRSQIKTYEDTVVKLTNMVNLDQEQLEILGRAWVGIDQANKMVDIVQSDRRETINDIRQEMRQERIAAIDSKELKAVLDSIGKLEKEKASLDGKAIENNLMFDIRNILELPINFVSLITPNDTSLVKPLADKMSKYRDYSELEGAFGMTDSRDATRYLEPAYNIYKHDSNAVGKATLGLGAVDNTYNTIFNRIGAYMNPEYLKGGKKNERRATILMDHNTRQLEDDKKGISLSNLYDVNNEIKIADVINQLMNGWVDVAKDAWIFDIQGNKQVSPVLLFLIQSGVPLSTAVYFVSNPLIKEYVKEQNIATSAFAKANRENPASLAFYRDKAKIKVFDFMKVGNITKLNQQGRRIVDDKKVYQHTLKVTEGLNFDEQSAFDITELDATVAANNSKARAAFFHYLELEDLAKGVSNMKLKLNYDTSRSNSLFDAQRAEADLIQLQEESMFPPEVVQSILDESPIGSFRIAPFQLELWGPLFEIRNNSELNSYLINRLSEMKNIKKMENIYGSTEKYIEEFKNDIVVKMFTDGLKKYKLKDKTYKGLELAEYSDKQRVMFKRGAYYSEADGKFYIDKQTLDMQFEQDLYSNEYKPSTPIVNNALRDITYGKLNLARVPVEAFKSSENSKAEYYQFVIEREYQRAVNPFSKLSKTEYFKYRLDKNNNKYKGVVNLSGQDFADEMLKRTYEEILRDTALDNIMNYWKIFRSNHTYADQLYELKEMHPNLEVDFNIVRDLIVSQSATKTKTPDGEEKETIKFKNIVLRDNRVKEDLINIYYNNMIKLSDGSTVSIPITKENAEQDYIENQRVAKFFSNLPLVGFLQSGLNSKDSMSIMRAMPTDKITSIIQEEAETFKINKDFLENFTSRFDYQNRLQNISTRRRLKNYVTQDLDIIPNRELVEEYDDGKLITYPSDKKQLKDLIKNNPNVIFALESSKGYPTFGAASYDFDNVVPIDLKGDKELLDISLDNLQKLAESGTPVAFLNRSIGYGKVFTEKNKKTGQMIDQEMYEYLTTELFSRFGYENTYSRSVNEVKELIEQSQDLSDFDLEIPYNELEEARDRLNCKI